MNSEFHKTMMGTKFYGHDVPRIVKALERIAEALEHSNKTPYEIMNPSEDEDEDEIEEPKSISDLVKSNYPYNGIWFNYRRRRI
jgi:hypothetical protein